MILFPFGTITGNTGINFALSGSLFILVYRDDKSHEQCDRAKKHPEVEPEATAAVSFKSQTKSKKANIKGITINATIKMNGIPSSVGGSRISANS